MDEMLLLQGVQQQTRCSSGSWTWPHLGTSLGRLETSKLRPRSTPWDWDLIGLGAWPDIRIFFFFPTLAQEILMNREVCTMKMR